MSRTRRKGCTWKYLVRGQYLTWDEATALRKALGYKPWVSLGWTMVAIREPQRDGNPNDMTSPPRWFKRQHRQEERRAQDAAVRDGKEMPLYRKRDRWDWW